MAPPLDPGTDASAKLTRSFLALTALGLCLYAVGWAGTSYGLLQWSALGWIAGLSLSGSN